MMADAMTISDATLASIPSQVMSGDDVPFNDDSLADMFDSTIVTAQTSTQNDIATTPDVELIHSTLDNSSICISNCNVTVGNRKKDPPLVQCHLCQHWYHAGCVGEKDKDIINTWTCPSCRQMPTTLNLVVNMLAQLQKDNSSLRRLITNQMRDVNVKIDRHSDNDSLITKLRKDNDDLRHQVANTQRKLDSQTWRQFQQPPLNKTVILGSSIVRSISEDQLVLTDVICKPGAKIVDIKRVVTDLLPDYSRAIIVVGGNDCDQDHLPTTPGPKNPAEIVDEYRSLIVNTKLKVPSVTVSSICPRMKSDETRQCIDAVNAGLQVVCAEENVSFIDNTPSFFLGDGNVNDGYLTDDGIHLTQKATDKLARNLQLRLKDGYKSVCNNRRHNYPTTRRTQLPAQQTPNTDSDELSHSFWHHARAKAGPHQPARDTLRRERPESRHERSQQDERSTITLDSNRLRGSCYNCGEDNHNTRRCRYSYRIQCNECESLGHKAKHHIY